MEISILKSIVKITIWTGAGLRLNLSAIWKRRWIRCHRPYINITGEIDFLYELLHDVRRKI